VPARYLPIYLNDHLAALTLGVLVAQRARAANDGELGELLEWLHGQLEEDRQWLLALMRRLGIAPSAAKVAGAHVAERLGRLKPNGHVTSYSPLSRLVELDALAASLAAKAAFWGSLQQVPDERIDAQELERLGERAREQRERLEPHRVAAAATALGPDR
jgi:hypothetical protein